jgi:hypothetical protein
MSEFTVLSAMQQLGFMPQDYLLLLLAPLGAGLGSIVHGMLIEINPNKLPTSGRLRTTTEVMMVLKWSSYRLVIGAVLGLVVALYFVGSITSNPTSIARILALSVFVGYAAPKLWALQEKHLMDEIEKKVRAAVCCHLGDAAVSAQNSEGPSMKQSSSIPPVPPKSA